MYTFKKGLRTTGIVFAIIAVVLTLARNLITLFAYLSTNISIDFFTSFFANLGITLVTSAIWIIILVRGRKDLLACIFLGIQALLCVSGVFSIARMPVSGIASLVSLLAYGLLAVDCAVDLKLQPSLKSLLLGGGVALCSLLSIVGTLSFTISNYSKAGMFQYMDFGDILAILLPNVLSLIMSLPGYAMRIITAFCLAGTNKVPKDGAPAPQQPQYQAAQYQNYPYQQPQNQYQQYQNPQYQGQQYQQPQYQGQQYQQPQYQAPQYQQPQYQQPQYQGQQYQQPQYQGQQYQQPQYQGQQYQAPQYQAPQYQQPQYQAPQQTPGQQ